MKKALTLTLLLFCCPLCLIAQHAVVADFDEGVELMTVVWRLAGAREYNTCNIEPYNRSVDEHFAPFRQHQAVTLAQSYYHQHGTGYDAVAIFGALLHIDDKGNVGFDPHKVKNFDHRWTPQMQNNMLVALSDFYKTSHFRQWYESTASLQQQARASFQKTLDKVDTQWFSRFFTAQEAQFRIILCPLAGNCNYGINYNTTEGIHQLSPVISCAHYADGQFSYRTDDVLPIVIHEFCHAYCNPLIDKHFDEIKLTADSVFALNSELLAGQAYSNSKIMMYETFVRSSVICYYLHHYPDMTENVQKMIKDEESNGFLLSRTMVDELAHYQQQASCIDMASFMPQLIKTINSFSTKHYLEQKTEADKKLIHYTCNISSGTTQLPAGLLTFTFTFDRPMQPAIGFGYTNDKFPEYKSHSWSDDGRTLTVQFNTQPNTQYGILVMGDQFTGTDGQSAVTSTIRFATR